MRDHARTCERHVGVGLAREDILAQGLPLPMRDMVPKTIEEIIICYADEFFSKTDGTGELPLETVIAGVQRYGSQADRFMVWHAMFEPESTIHAQPPKIWLAPAGYNP